MALEGQATSILPTLPAKERTDYSALKTALEKRFNPKIDPDIAADSFQHRKRRRGESYVQYAQQLKRLVTMAYDDWPPAHIERLARERFFASLDDQNLKVSLWTKSPQTVEQAAVWADTLDGMNNTSNHNRNYTATGTNERNSYRDQQEQNSKKGTPKNQNEKNHRPVGEKQQSPGRNNQVHEPNRGNGRRNRPPYNSRRTSNYRPPPTAYSNRGREYQPFRQGGKSKHMRSSSIWSLSTN